MKRTMMIAVFMLFAGTALAQEPWLEITVYNNDGTEYSKIRVNEDDGEVKGIAEWAAGLSQNDAVLLHLLFENGKATNAKSRLIQAVSELRERLGPVADDILEKYGVVISDQYRP